MVQNIENTSRELQIVSDGQELQNTLIIAIQGRDRHVPLENLGLTFNSSEEEILDVVRPMIQEGFGVDIRDSSSGWHYKVQKATNNNNVYIYTNSPAGRCKS